MAEFNASTIADSIVGYIKACGWSPEEVAVRISMGSELERVLRYGTTRAGKSDMVWDKLPLFSPEELPRWPIKHEDVVIASTVSDLVADSRLERGTLEDKLRMYAEPFATFYDRRMLTELLKENPGADSKNQGRHWLFNGDKRGALLGVARLFTDGTSQAVQRIPLSGRVMAFLPERPRRFYFALTNFCNRSCELCCCHSDPRHGTFLSFEVFERTIRCGEPYEAQMEGGEPLLHPDFDKMAGRLAEDPACLRVVLCTNATMLPWEGGVDGLAAWLARFSRKPFLLKPSINAHLLERDPRHLDRMGLLRAAFETIGWPEGSGLLFNVRRRPDVEGGERWIVEELERRGLADISNDFVYQRLGKAEDEEGLDRPYVIPDPVRFSLISPDGIDFGCDLIARADHMKTLP